MKKARNLLKISSIYLGTVLGAGFASGQELSVFFVQFSRRGILGCILAGLLFCVLGALITSKAWDLGERTHRNYLHTVFGERTAGIFALVTELFLCVSFCVMLSGAGAFFKERLSLPPLWGILLTDLLCLIVFLYDLEGVGTVNLLLAPVMLFGVIFVAVYSLAFGDRPVFALEINQHSRFLPYALFYVGYNMLTATAVLVPASSLAESKKTAMWGGALGGILLSVMAILCTVALYFSKAVSDTSLPMLILAGRVGGGIYQLYSAVLFMAMLTTAVSTGFSITQRLQSVGMKQKTSAFLVCLAAIPFSFVEFSVWVRYSYLLFGIPGVIMIGGILWNWYKKL